MGAVMSIQHKRKSSTNPLFPNLYFSKKILQKSLVGLVKLFSKNLQSLTDLPLSGCVCGGDGLGGEEFYLPLCWFSLNNSETIQTVTVAFCSIQ